MPLPFGAQVGVFALLEDAGQHVNYFLIFFTLYPQSSSTSDTAARNRPRFVMKLSMDVPRSPDSRIMPGSSFMNAFMKLPSCILQVSLVLSSMAARSTPLTAPPVPHEILQQVDGEHIFGILGG